MFKIKLAFLTAALGLTFAAQASALDFLDEEFAGLICEGWNQTDLPHDLGRNGSGWIDSAGSHGHQVMVITRRDCDGWHPVKLVIDADSSGNAHCTSGEAFTGGSFQWRFEPASRHWADFTDGFGASSMPRIMSGFEGPYTTAMNNIDNFEVFFAMVGWVARESGADWECSGTNMNRVNNEWGDVHWDRARRHLSGMDILD